MTIIDKVESTTRAQIQAVLDKEPVNYLEGASLYGTIAQGRYNLSVLEILYNHAQDPELKNLITEAIDRLVIPTIEHCERLLEESGAQIPQFQFNDHKLHKDIDIPSDARLTDNEVAAGIGTMAKAAQVALLSAMHQAYQLEVGVMFRKYLDEGIDWNYRLLQLMIHRGWLPHLAKVIH